jgi:AcrR family transcriptional regulator
VDIVVTPGVRVFIGEQTGLSDACHHTDLSVIFKPMAATTPLRPSARERLLDAADELFYAEGVNTVGIDRVIEHAGVAKATLYSTFGSKDALIRAYLDRRQKARKERIAQVLEEHDDPRERLLGVIGLLSERFSVPDSRGCAFINAGAEASHGSGIEQANDEYRAWLRGLFVDLARDAGAVDPEVLARQLQLLNDGTAVSARMDREGVETAAAAQSAAAALLDAAIRA